MGDLRFRGVQAYDRTWGDGWPLVLLHSGGASSVQWQKVAEHSAGGRRLIAPDFLGFGKSQSWPEPEG